MEICNIKFFKICWILETAKENRSQHRSCKMQQLSSTLNVLSFCSSLKLPNTIPTWVFNFKLKLCVLRAIFCKSHPTCDWKVFRISSYFNQLKMKVILEYGWNFSFIKHFIGFLGGSRDNSSFSRNAINVHKLYFILYSIFFFYLIGHKQRHLILAQLLVSYNGILRIEIFLWASDNFFDSL